MLGPAVDVRSDNAADALLLLEDVAEGVAVLSIGEVLTGPISVLGLLVLVRD